MLSGINIVAVHAVVDIFFHPIGGGGGGANYGLLHFGHFIRPKLAQYVVSNVVMFGRLTNSDSQPSDIAVRGRLLYSCLLCSCLVPSRPLCFMTARSPQNIG